MQRTYLIILISLLYSGLFAKDAPPPLVKGTVNISIQQGTIDCDLTFTNISPVADYLIMLNTGMNIRSIRNADNDYSFYYDRVYNTDIGDEAFGYYIPSNKEGIKYMPKTLHFSYTGKYPVVNDTINTPHTDWKGNIAFNGYSVRADGYQTCWYPVLYDIKNDKKYDKVSCDIIVTCTDCSSIYINGNKPVSGNTAHFINSKPFELMLYAGKYAIKNVDNTYFLNPDLNEQQMGRLAAVTTRIKQYYEQKLGIPYKYSIKYINTTPTSLNNAWMFVSYPTIVNIGRGEYGLNSFEGMRKERAPFFLSHELGHYYFGYYKQFNSPIGDACSEGIAEYLGMRACKQLFSDTMYRQNIDKKIHNLEKFNAIPLGNIKHDSDYHNRELYVYNYAPLILLAIQKDIGTDATWRWLSAMLRSDEPITDYAFLVHSLQDVLRDEKKLKHIRMQYLESDNSLQHAVKRVQE